MKKIDEQLDQVTGGAAAGTNRYRTKYSTEMLTTDGKKSIKIPAHAEVTVKILQLYSMFFVTSLIEYNKTEGYINPNALETF